MNEVITARRASKGQLINVHQAGAPLKNFALPGTSSLSAGQKWLVHRPAPGDQRLSAGADT